MMRLMSAATTHSETETRAPADGPFAALWLLFRQLLGMWRSAGSGFEAAFEAAEAEFQEIMLVEAIKAYNADSPDLQLDSKDFEIRAVRRGRGCVYDIFAKSGRSLGDEIAYREAEGRRETERAYFNFRRLAAQFRRWTWSRKRTRGKVSNAHARIGRAGRTRLASRLRAAGLSGVSGVALASSSRAPP